MRARRATSQLIFGAVLGAISAGNACTTEEGTTPACADAAECTTYAVCEKDPRDPSACCVDSAGTPFVGPELAQCLRGYGVVDAGAGSGRGGAGGTGDSGGPGGSGG